MRRRDGKRDRETARLKQTSTGVLRLGESAVVGVGQELVRKETCVSACECV